METSSFCMVIDYRLFLDNRGGVVFGTIQSGILRVGDEIEIVTKEGQHIKVFVEAIEMFRKMINEASQGQNVGIILRNKDITREIIYTISEGDMVYEAGTAPA